jgi:phage repressor protein C with HTH and peptisase S24 domain
MEQLAEKVSEIEGLAKPLSWQTVQQWENGTSAPKRKRLATVAKLLGVNLLAEGVEDPKHFKIDPDKYRLAWVVGRGSGGFLPETLWTEGDYPVGAEQDYAEVASADPHAFLVEVIGGSMIPRYNPGEFALAEPGTEPDLEDDVLVRLKSGQTMIKKLLSRRGGYHFKSYNDPEILHYTNEEVTWVYYVAHPVPVRKIKTRV